MGSGSRDNSQPCIRKLITERTKLIGALSKYQESASKTRSFSAIGNRVQTIDKILKEKSKLPTSNMAHAITTNKKTTRTPTNLELIPPPIRPAVARSLESQGLKNPPVTHSPQIITNRIDDGSARSNDVRQSDEENGLENESLQSVRKQYEGIIEQMKRKNEEELQKQKAQLVFYKTAVENSTAFPPRYTGTIPKEPQQREAVSSADDDISVDSYLQFSTEAFSPRKFSGDREPKPMGSSTETRPRNRPNNPPTLQPQSQTQSNHNNNNSENSNMMPIMQQLVGLLQNLPQQNQYQQQPPQPFYPTQQYPNSMYPQQTYPPQSYPPNQPNMHPQYPYQQYPPQQYPVQPYPPQQCRTQNNTPPLRNAARELNFPNENTSNLERNRNTSNSRENRAYTSQDQHCRRTFLRNLDNIPLFSGKSYTELRNFIEICDSINDHFENDAEYNEFMMKVSFQLRGDARSVLTNNANWAHIKNELFSKYDHLSDLTVLDSKISNLHQEKTESLDNYAKRALDLLTEKNSSFYPMPEKLKTTHEKIAIDAFANGLFDKRLRDTMIVQYFSSLREVISRSLAVETKLKNTIQRREMCCNFCKNIGHLEYECQNKENNSSPMGQLVTALKGLTVKNQQTFPNARPNSGFNNNNSSFQRNNNFNPNSQSFNNNRNFNQNSQPLNNNRNFNQNNRFGNNGRPNTGNQQNLGNNNNFPSGYNNNNPSNGNPFNQRNNNNNSNRPGNFSNNNNGNNNRNIQTVTHTDTDRGLIVDDEYPIENDTDFFEEDSENYMG